MTAPSDNMDLKIVYLLITTFKKVVRKQEAYTNNISEQFSNTKLILIRNHTLKFILRFNYLGVGKIPSNDIIKYDRIQRVLNPGWC